MNILIVDDEPLARQRLAGLVQNLDGYTQCADASNGHETLKLVQELKPDIILLDIRMPGMDGLEVARHLNKLSKPPAIIFTTAFSDHALQAFEAHAIDYLVKPIKQERLQEALKAARRLTRPQLQQINQSDATDNMRNNICVKVRGSLELIPVSDIHYFLADQKYVTLKTSEHEHLIEESLKSLEDEFGHLFTRIHRNALVANQYITGMEKNNDGHHVIVLQNIEDRLEISRRHLPLVRKKIKAMASSG
ncbi:MAG: LytTR family DNA-binding domain-containing protein [Gammaproteobacteria bacterium]|nr:LytTR family DNA-binding domain-containing protein [Gammaproteobacteria bacterium]MCW8909384.1 LytTR family DNA-binding domain-containing protein [Gammaproteobacteria bacterium]MCW9004581.1 LytTR family DNA-binding domain-containing protein [Gammaproteobacteria bacterium]MCW9056592.1 LytTR family DNA-binding domain-containing protein [Gammaproteobacteria bacterium]